MLFGGFNNAKEVWTNLRFTWDADNDTHVGEEEWFKNKMQTLKPEELQQLGYSMWYIWSLRDHELYGEDRISAAISTYKIRALIDEFIAANAPELASPYVPKPKWRKPEPDVVKINFDGAFDKNSNHGGI